MIFASEPFVPVILKGVIVDRRDPLTLDFIVDTGDTQDDAEQSMLASESKKLVKYFLASMTIPSKDQWVNLSPYEKDRMMTGALSKTELGRDMLAQDYMLKQVMASSIYPEKELGRAFWDKVYAKAHDQFGVTDVPMDTFNKVWIVAEKANVYVNRKSGQDKLAAFIVDSHLKVMLDTDYVATTNNRMPTGGHVAPQGYVSPSTLPNELGLNVKAPQVSTESQAELTKQIIREVILPALEEEVNKGKTFANLRQIFHSMILATWYKKTLKQAVLTQVYADQKRIAGVKGSWALGRNVDVDPEAVYARYVEAYKKGVFNYIKEDIDASTGERVAHKYFSGGLTQMAKADEVDEAMISEESLMPAGRNMLVTVKNELDTDMAEGDLPVDPNAVVAQLNKEKPEGYPQRNMVSPVDYTSDEVKKNARSRTNLLGWAHEDLDAPTLPVADKTRIQARVREEIRRFAPWTKFVNNMPRNPVNTGMTGRGDLGRYGPNPAEDAVVMRYNKDGQLEVLAGLRLDGGGMALPGVLLRFGEEDKVGVAASRRLFEETNATIDLTKGTVVYEGHSKDWRDTNDAWVITRGIAVILSYEESLMLKLEAKEGMESGSVKFVPVDDLDGFYARHKMIIESAVGKVQSGQIKTAEESQVKKFAPLNITMPQIEKAFQAFKEGKIELAKTFDVVIPQAPHGGNYVVVAGIETTLNDIRRLRFLPEHIQSLRDMHYFTEEFLQYLADFQFQGDIDAIQEGRIVADGLPLMRVKANEVEIELLSALLKNRIGQACNIATKTSRIVQAANGAFVSDEAIARLQREKNLSPEQIRKFRAVMDFGLRRGQGDGAFLASLAAIIGGAVGTSNEQAAKLYDIMSMGSIAHAFIMMFAPEDEIEAFRLYVDAFPKNATLLVDTYDTLKGVEKAIIVAKEMEARGEKLYGIRLDSGDIVALSQDARRMLNEAGLHYVKIVASDDLDEYKITDYLERGAQIDVFGVGTNLITGGQQATLDVQIVPSEGKRFWRSMVNGKVGKYIMTLSGRSAYAAVKEQVNELLTPFWEAGRRVIGIEQPWSGHERTLAELDRLSPEQKGLQSSGRVVIDSQDSNLTINRDTDVVLYVDDQGAFKAGQGGLPVAGGDEIAGLIQQSLELFDPNDRYASLDRHERGSVSWHTSYNGLSPFTVLTYDMVKDWKEQENRLASHAKFTLDQLKEYLKAVGFQVLWTEHADERLPESKLPGYVTEKMFKFIQVKGMDPTVDSYSPFEDNLRRATGLADVIRKNKPGTKRIFLAGGLAFDYCVGFAALGAIKEGFEVILVRDATRSVGSPEGSVEAMEKLLLEKGVKIIDSTDMLIAANNTKGVYPATKVQGNFSHPPLLNIEESSALTEDKYHLTMAYAFFKGGYKEKISTFDYFFRQAPYGQDHVIFSGVRVLAEKLKNFRFTPSQIQHLRQQGIYREDFLSYLSNFKFSGDIISLPEGSAGFANEPLLKVTGPLIETLIIESLILNKLNFNSLISTLANIAYREAGEDSRLVEDGLAGAHGESHQEASLSAFYGGVLATTNVDANLNFRIPVAWSNDEGRFLGPELITGGEKSSLGGVYKMAVFEGQPRIKLGATSVKTTRPGDKEFLDIVNEDGVVIDRVTALVDETLDLPVGQKTARRYMDVVKKGDVVFVPQDPFEVRALALSQEKIYARVHESRMSPGLSQLQQEMFAAITGKGTDKAEAIKGGIDLNADQMEFLETGDNAEFIFDQTLLARFGRGEFAGLDPVVIRMAPLADVRPLLGISQ